jgi:hypothetical protein
MTSQNTVTFSPWTICVYIYVLQFDIIDIHVIKQCGPDYDVLRYDPVHCYQRYCPDIGGNRVLRNVSNDISTTGCYVAKLS